MGVEQKNFGNFFGFVLATGVTKKMGMAFYLYTDKKSLIDTASRTMREDIKALLPSLGSVESAYITHFHEDHTGNAAFFKRVMQVEIFAPQQSIEMLAKKNGFKIQSYRKIFWGRAEPFESKPLPENFEFGGMRVRTIPAFGHSFDHHTFFAEDTGYLFSGDLVLFARNYHMMREEDLVNLVKSLKFIAKLPLKKIFCAHRGVLKPDTLLQKLEFYKEVAQKVKNLYKPNISIGELTRKVAGRAKLADFISLWHYSRIHLIRKMVDVVKDDSLYKKIFDY